MFYHQRTGYMSPNPSPSTTLFISHNTLNVLPRRPTEFLRPSQDAQTIYTSHWAAVCGSAGLRWMHLDRCCVSPRRRERLERRRGVAGVRRFCAARFESGRGDRTWTMGMRYIRYLRCRHSAYVSVSFSILFSYIPSVYRLHSAPSSPTASP